MHRSRIVTLALAFFPVEIESRIISVITGIPYDLAYCI